MFFIINLSAIDNCAVISSSIEAPPGKDPFLSSNILNPPSSSFITADEITGPCILTSIASVACIILIWQSVLINLANSGVRLACTSGAFVRSEFDTESSMSWCGNRMVVRPGRGGNAPACKVGM